MFALLKSIIDFVNAVLAFLRAAGDDAEIAEQVTSEIGSFTESDVMIRPIVIDSTHILPYPGTLFYLEGRHYVVEKPWQYQYRGLTATDFTSGGYWPVFLPHFYATSNFAQFSEIKVAEYYPYAEEETDSEFLRMQGFFRTPARNSARRLIQENNPMLGELSSDDPLAVKYSVGVDEWIGHSEAIVTKAMIHRAVAPQELIANQISFPAIYGQQLYQSVGGGHILSFLFRGKRIYMSPFNSYMPSTPPISIYSGWSCISSNYTKLPDMTSPGWFIRSSHTNQVYSPLERELLYFRTEFKSPLADKVSHNGNLAPSTTSPYTFTNNCVGAAEDANGNLYSLHWIIDNHDQVSSNAKIVLMKNLKEMDCWLLNFFEGGNRRDFGSVRGSIATSFGNDHNLVHPHIGIIGDQLIIGQQNKLYILSFDGDLQGIRELPFVFEQMYIADDKVCFAHRGGVTICSI